MPRLFLMLFVIGLLYSPEALLAQTAPPPASPVTALSPAPYLLAADDVIGVTVLNMHSLSVPQMPVSPEGTISVPLLDPVKVVGMTTTEVTALLTTQWKKYIKNPSVSVILIQKRQDSVLMYGEVQKPGATTYKPLMHLLELLAWTGGPIPDADLAHTVVTHKDGTRQQIDLSHPESKGGTDQDLVMQNGDVAYIPPRNVSVTVVGEVLHPGSYPFKEDMTVLDAITAAGSINPDTVDYEAATLIHNGKETKLDLDGMMRHGDTTGNVKLSPGDRINVPLIQRRIYVFGAVARPGFYPYKPHDRLIEAIEYCGGHTQEADMRRVIVIHINKDKTEAKPQKIDLTKFLKEGKMEYNIALVPGDVIYMPDRKKGIQLSDLWNLLAPLNMISLTGRLITGQF